jgi:hypothetical protein
MSTTYSEGGSGSGKVKRTRRGDREGPWFGAESSGTETFVPKGNEAGVCMVGVTFGRSSGHMELSRTGVGVTRYEDNRTVSSPKRKQKVFLHFYYLVRSLNKGFPLVVPSGFGNLYSQVVLVSLSQVSVLGLDPAIIISLVSHLRLMKIPVGAQTQVLYQFQEIPLLRHWSDFFRSR